ncbi:hypothetical protein V8E53_004543 [Lactarius tabidus]
MADCATIPLEAHNNRSVYLEQAWNIGRAYRNQAMALISICQPLFRIAPPKLVHQDAELRRHRLDFPLSVYSKIEIAKRIDSVEREQLYVDESGQTMTIKFVLLQSPLLTPHDKEPITMRAHIPQHFGVTQFKIQAEH